jgi:hypothetical protein
LGISVLAAALLTFGLVGIAVFTSAVPASPATSPLAALLAFAWSCAYIGAAIFTWRGSRLAGPLFIVAIGLALPLLFFVFPNRIPFVPLLVSLSLVGAGGFWYLNRAPNLAV